MEKLIVKIQELKQIQPENQWVKATKAQILGQGSASHLLPNFAWLNSRAFLVVPAILIMFMVGNFYYNRNVLYPEMLSVDLEILESISAGLRAVESDISRTTANLEKISEPEKALAVKDMVDSAIENAEKVVAVSKQMTEKPRSEKKSPQIFSVINSVEYAAQNLEYALDGMEETYIEKQKELAKNLIDDLENSNLAESQLLLLSEAKDCYNEGRFGEALAKALEIKN